MSDKDKRIFELEEALIWCTGHPDFARNDGKYAEAVESVIYSLLDTIEQTPYRKEQTALLSEDVEDIEVKIYKLVSGNVFYNRFRDHQFIIDHIHPDAKPEEEPDYLVRLTCVDDPSIVIDDYVYRGYLKEYEYREVSEC